ncbi:MAG: hypothetical protein ACRD2A_15405, partial [Vicinamibacterales bacterium]
EDARVEDDVLSANRDFLVYDVSEFNGAAVGAEWLVPLGSYLEGGIGIGFSRRTVHSVYADFVDNDGTEIDQRLRLRLLPIAFTVRVIPTSQSSPIQPYFGAGLAVINWRYSESGEFLDFSDRTIFDETYVATGSETGPVVLGGIRFVGDAATGGFEIRYHKADGDLDNRFYVPKIDLGGWTYNFTVGLRF